MPRPKPIYLSIKNFDKYQHYKHRNPPWIKLYYSLLDDAAFTSLSEVDQSRLMKLFLVASKQQNRILYDQIYLAKMLRIIEPVDVSRLIASGFVLASRKHFDSTLSPKPHVRVFRVTETETEKKKTIEKESVADATVRVLDEFEIVWKTYPRKTAKAVAKKAWGKMNGTRPPTDQLLQAIQTQKNSEQWQRGVIPHFATWLNQKRWEDQLPAQQELIPPIPPASDPIARGLWHQAYGDARRK